MKAYDLYQRMSSDIYKVEEGLKNFRDEQALKPVEERQDEPPAKDFLTPITDSDGSVWVVEKTYSNGVPYKKDDGNNIHTEDGYAGAIYKNSATGEVVVVNAGTFDATDKLVDWQMKGGYVPNQYSSARELVQDAIAIVGGDKSKISVTGDSLGYSLAQFQAVEFNLAATGFDGYGVLPILQGVVGNENSGGGYPVVSRDELNRINHELYPDLFASFESGNYDPSKMINYKDSQDPIANSQPEVGCGAILKGDGKTSGDLLVEAIIVNSVEIFKMDGEGFFKGVINHMLSHHGIEQFAGINPEVAYIDYKDLSDGRCVATSLNGSNLSQYDPLILDLDNDGVETVGLDAGVLFDHDADGIKTGTGWVGPDDALLVRDINANGQIDSGRELFGDNTLLQDGGKAKDAFAAIKNLDTSGRMTEDGGQIGDGKLDSNDAAWNELKVWQDLNQNGISEATELKKLEEIGIKSISVEQSQTGAQNQENGNVIIGNSVFEREDGSTQSTGALNFIGDSVNREFSEAVDTTGLEALPNTQGTGVVRDLREAVALSTDLKTKLEAYIANSNRQDSELMAIIESWAATGEMTTLASTLKPGGHPEGARGTNLSEEYIDKLEVLEKFTGMYAAISNFVDPMDTQDGVQDGRYSGQYYGINIGEASIDNSYNALFTSIKASIGVQTYAKDMLEGVAFKLDATGLSVDFSGVFNQVNGIQDLITGALVLSHLAYNANDIFDAENQQVVINQFKTYFSDSNSVIYNNMNESNAGSELLIVINTYQELANKYLGLGLSKNNQAVLDTYAAKITEYRINDNEELAKYILSTGNTKFQVAAYSSISENSQGPVDFKRYVSNVDNLVNGDSNNNQLSGSSARDLILGRAGDDTINGGNGNDSLYGGAGNDTITGGNDKDILYGGAGDDIINANGGSNPVSALGFADQLFGGEGNDKLYAGNAYGGIEFTGGIGNDYLEGNYAGNTYYFNLGDGNDTINELADDGYHSAEYNARFEGKYGYRSDAIVFGEGISKEDLKFSKSDNDLFIQVGANDSITLKDAYLSANRLIESFVFANGEKISFEEVLSSSYTRETSDTIYGFDRNDNIDAGAGDDIVFGEYGDDLIDGGAGNDVISGGNGTDILYGGAGDDIINANGGSDYIYVVGLDQLFGDAGNDKLYAGNTYGGIEFTGGIGNDYLEGNYAGNTYYFNLGDGHDTINELADDGYRSFEYNVRFEGKYGYRSDAIVFGEGISKEDLKFSESDNDLIIQVGIEGQDSIRIKDHFINGSRQIESLVFADQTKFLLADYQQYIELNLNGSDLDEILLGNLGNDTIIGNAGADQLEGKAGNDSLHAGTGDDYLDGGLGNDSMDGGLGNDKYVFKPGDGVDEVIDNGGEDRVKLTQTKLKQLKFHMVDDDLVIENKKNSNDEIKIKHWAAGGDNQIEWLELDAKTLDLVKIFNDYQKTRFGSEDNDSLELNRGEEIVNAGVGNDKIIDNTGSNTIYKYELGDGKDIIQDSNSNLDQISFGEGISLDALSFKREQNNLIIELNHQDQIMIEDYINSKQRIEKIVFYDGTEVLIDSKLTEIGIYASGAEHRSTNQDLWFNSGGEYFLGTNTDKMYINDSSGGGFSSSSFSNNGFAGGNFEGGSRPNLNFRMGGDLSYFENLPQPNNPPTNIPPNNIIYINSQGLDSNLYGGDEANRVVIYGTSNNILRLSGGANQISLEDGNNKIYLGSGNDIIKAGDGDNLIYAEDGENIIELGIGNNAILAGRNNDQIKIKGGNNIIKSFAGDDVIEVGFGNDTIEAGAGNDIITGGAGDDYLNGGLGDDTYYINLGDGNDRIAESGGKDKIVFGEGIKKEDLSFAANEDDLSITNLKTNERVIIEEWFKSEEHQVETIELSSGEILINQAVNSLIQAMASFNSTPMEVGGFTTMGANNYSNLLKDYWFGGGS